ncbi:MAG: hypothetical protein M3Z04_20205 [Chloroflexota bacterium]|nr:hypothetical protein [Chloroflexota bacterium]
MVHREANAQGTVTTTEVTAAVDQKDADALTLSFVVDPTSTVPIQYANQLTLQQVDGLFLLSFFQTIPPILLGDRDEQAAQLQELKTIAAPCVGRIMIAPNRLPEFARVLTGLAEHLLDKEKEEV